MESIRCLRSPEENGSLLRNYKQHKNIILLHGANHYVSTIKYFICKRINMTPMNLHMLKDSELNKKPRTPWESQRKNNSCNN